MKEDLSKALGRGWLESLFLRIQGYYNKMSERGYDLHKRVVGWVEQHREKDVKRLTLEELMEH
jgi:hypothetical protein